MTITVRLTPEQSRKLQAACRRLGATRSEAVRYALELLERQAQTGATAADRLRPWIGAWDSRGKNYSEDTHRKAAELIRAKHERRRSR